VVASPWQVAHAGSGAASIAASMVASLIGAASLAASTSGVSTAASSGCPAPPPQAVSAEAMTSSAHG
jgi:hypothetical protein